MGRTNSASSLFITGLLVFFVFSAESVWARPTLGKWELALQSIRDRMQLRQDNGPSVPLKARITGIYGGHNHCLKRYSQSCLLLHAGMGFSSAVVESATPSYMYKDNGASVLHGNLGLGLMYRFQKTLSTVTGSADLELRNASYKSPGPPYVIREENLSYHLWLKGQANFPISSKLLFTQSLLVAPLSSEFAYRIGLSF